MRVLLVDNLDSFTYNVADQLACLGASVDVRRCDRASAGEMLAAGPDAIVLSPGPGRPEDASVALDVIALAIRRRLPLLGICLGMQCIAHHFGATVERLPRVVHGSASDVIHAGLGVFSDAPRPLAGGRYHSLAVDARSLPAALVPTAATSEGVLMGLSHASLPLHGVQFHPESILTPDGDRVVERFLAEAADMLAPTDEVA